MKNDERRSGWHALAWIGVAFGVLAIVGGVGVVLAAGSNPKRAPTGEDYQKSCALFFITVGLFAAVCLGGLCSVVAVIVARLQKRALWPSLLALLLNVLPVAAALVYDVVYTRMK